MADPAPQSKTETRANQAREKLAGANFGDASFQKLASGIAQQTMIHLGMLPDPITNQREPNLDAAKYSIDLLDILRDKTKGNLDDDEANLLETSLYELRMAYISACQA